MNSLIANMESYAKENNVPIMYKDTIEYINNVIKEYNVSSILEIGTAIAYSTILFARNDSVKKLTSVERDIQRYKLALYNVKTSKLSNIELINDDALDININDKFDLIIIDAAKSQNIKFFEKFKNNLNNKGIIIIDNMNFHGLVHHSETIESKNLRALVKKLESFWDYIDSQSEYEVEYLDIGDGIAVCKKKSI